MNAELCGLLTDQSITGASVLADYCQDVGGEEFSHDWRMVASIQRAVEQTFYTNAAVDVCDGLKVKCTTQSTDVMEEYVIYRSRNARKYCGFPLGFSNARRIALALFAMWMGDEFEDYSRVRGM